MAPTSNSAKANWIEENAGYTKLPPEGSAQKLSMKDGCRKRPISFLGFEFLGETAIRLVDWWANGRIQKFPANYFRWSCVSMAKLA
jgi:hypothetical protein